MDAREVIELAAGAPPIEHRLEVDTSDIPETDFSLPDAVQGKHFECFVHATGLVRLDPDLREAFPDDASVNRALRRVFETAKELRIK
jgi:hypothetical protein